MDKVSFIYMDEGRIKPFRAFVTVSTRKSTITVSVQASIGDDPTGIGDTFSGGETFTETKLDFKEIGALRDFLRRELDNRVMEDDILTELNKRYQESRSQMAPITDIINKFNQLVLYGPAGGADLFIGNTVFRMKNDDFLTPKNFMIWYATVFRKTLTIDEVDWKALLDLWLQSATVADSSEDSLAPPVLEDLVNRIVKNRIVRSMSEEDVMNVSRGAASIFWLQADRTLHVPAKIYGAIGEKYNVSTRKMRQYMEKHLVEKSSKQVKLHGEVVRFWLYDWDKLCISFPQLKDIRIDMEVAVEEDDFTDIGSVRVSNETLGNESMVEQANYLLCEHCGRVFEEVLYLAHFEKNMVTEPIDRLFCGDCDLLLAADEYPEHLMDPKHKSKVRQSPVKKAPEMGKTETRVTVKTSAAVSEVKGQSNEAYGLKPTPDSVFSHLIDCTYNSSQKFRAVTELEKMLPLGVQWEPADIYKCIEALVKQGKVVKLKGKLKFGVKELVNPEDIEVK